MADYEDLVELGFEGVDKFADKYHDRAYNHLPAIPRRKKQRQQNQQQNLNNQHDQERQHLEHKQRHERGEADTDELSDLRSQHTEQRQDLRDRHQDQRKDLREHQEQQNQQWQAAQQYQQQYPQQGGRPENGHTSRRSAEFSNGNGYSADPNMYASDRQQRDHRSSSGSGERYYEDERIYYTGPNAGTVVPQTRAAYENMRNQQVAPYQPQSQRGFDDYYDSRDRGRPQPARRSSSWSPPRSERHDRRDRDRRSGRSRSGSRSNEKQHRILATVGGALVGGLVGSQARKGKSHDAAATVIGAVVGGLGAREAAEFMDNRKKKRERYDEKWEEVYGDDERRDNRARDERYERDHKYDQRY